MNNDVRQEASCCLFQFEGELRSDHVEGLRDLVDPAHRPGPCHVLVDCHRVSHYEEGAISALVAFQHDVAEAGGKVVLMGIEHPDLTRVVFLETGGLEPLSSTPL